MSRIRTLIASTLTLVGVFAGSQAADAASFDHIDHLALRLQSQSRDLYNNFRVRYRHTSEYSHLMSDAATMYRLASHVHDVAHEGCNLAHLQDDLRQLDRAFHHVEHLVDDIEHDAHYGHFGGHFGGHIYGNTHDIRRKLALMEDTLHHLRDDVEELAHPAIHDPHGHSLGYRPAPVVIGGGSGRGVYIGGRGFGIRIGN